MARGKGGVGKVLKRAQQAQASGALKQDTIVDELTKTRQKTKEEIDAENAKATQEATRVNTPAIVIFLAVLVIALGAFVFISSVQTEQATKTVDQMHEENLNGKESDVNYLYNGYSFVKAGNFWHTQINDPVTHNRIYDVRVRYGPREVLDIPIGGAGLGEEFRTEKSLTITHDPESDHLNYVALAAAEITLATAGVLKLDVQAACMQNLTEGCDGIPIVTCDGGSEGLVLELYQAEPTAVIMEGNCIKVQGQEEELMRAADRLVYEWLGIIRYS